MSESVFKKHSFSPQILMILFNSEVSLEPLWEHFGRTWGLLSIYEGDFGSLLGHFGTTLGALWAYDTYMCL